MMRRCKWFGLVVLLVVGWPSMVQADGSSAPRAWAEMHLAELIELYKHFHSHPELSFQEQETAERLAVEWEKAGFEVTRNVGGHGVVGMLKNGRGPTLMLRTDLDALPVTEETGLVYASQVKVTAEDGTQVGVMHACGHDVHITNLVGVARYLASNKQRWRGTLLLIGQPAEERGAGAKAMLDDGLFQRFPKPDFALALHVDALLPAGVVGYRPGFAMANVDSVDITVHGRGGHGAYPHTTVDPIVQAAQLVLALQTIVSRELNPIDSAVVTVGSIHGGTKHNVIGDQCHLQLTVRSYSDEVRQQILAAIRRKAEGIAVAAGAPQPTIEISEGTPALSNDEQLTRRLQKTFERVLGPENVHLADPSMGGEDFGRYGREGVPILMYRVGAVEPRRLERYKSLGQSPPSLHSPLFYPDIEPTLTTSLTTMIEASLELLKP